MSKFRFIYLMGALVMMLISLACARDKAPEECVEPASVERVPLPATQAHNPDDHWCQSCVISPSAYISCQKIYGKLEEGEAKLRKDSLIKACKDAGFAGEDCPEDSMLSSICKGEKIDPEKFKEAGERLKLMLPKVPNLPASKRATAPEGE